MILPMEGKKSPNWATFLLWALFFMKKLSSLSKQVSRQPFFSMQIASISGPKIWVPRETWCFHFFIMNTIRSTYLFSFLTFTVHNKPSSMFFMSKYIHIVMAVPYFLLVRQMSSRLFMAWDTLGFLFLVLKEQTFPFWTLHISNHRGLIYGAML